MFKKKEKEMKLEKIKLDISIKDFIEYLETHMLLVVLTIFILLLFHGYLLFSNSIAIDTDIFLQNPSMEYNWYSIGRFGMVFEKYLLGIFSFSMYYSQILFFIFIISFMLVSYYAFYKLSGKDVNIGNLILPLVIFSSAIWAEQLIFFIQMAQIAFSLTVLTIAILWIYKWCLDKNVFYLLGSIASMVLIFGTYQSFMVVYIIYCILGFLLLYENKNISKELNMFTLITKLLVTFVVAFLLYEIVCMVIGTDYTYLDATNSWKYATVEETLQKIKNHIVQIIIGEGIFYSRFFSVILVLFLFVGIYKTIKKEELKNKIERIVYCLSYLVMGLVPFLLTIYCGQAPVVRAQFYIPIFEGILMFFLFMNTNKRILKYGIVLLTYVVTVRQLYYLETLYYTDNLRYEHDVNFVEELELTLRENNVPYGSKIVIIGHRPKNLNPSCLEGDMVSVPLATINRVIEPYYYWSSSSVVTFLKNRGYYYVNPSKEDFEVVFRYSEEMEKTWPEEDCIELYHGCYVIKVSNDELMLELYDMYR